MKQWIAQPVVRGLLVGAVVIAVASALKLYADRDVVDPAAQRAQIDDHLLALHDALKDTLKQSPDPDVAMANLPHSLPWLPANLRCADQPQTPTTQDAAAWAQLGWPLVTQETPRAYAYQITVRRVDSKVAWIARRDTDCDGIYEVHTLRGDLGWGDTFKSTHVKTQHIDE